MAQTEETMDSGVYTHGRFERILLTTSSWIRWHLLSFITSIGVLLSSSSCGWSRRSSEFIGYGRSMDHPKQSFICHIISTKLDS